MENNDILSHFYDCHFHLDEDAILEMNKHCNSGSLNNVIVGIETHCYGLYLIDEEKEIIYRIFYVNGEDKLEGSLIQLSLNLKYRDELVLCFANYLSQNHESLDLIDTFNIFQSHTRAMLEKIGFYTVTSNEIKGYINRNLEIIAKGTRGIILLRIIQRIEFYKSFFGNKNLFDETIDAEYIYLMLNKRNYYIKIGKSKRPIFREKTLQADEPDIELIKFWKAPSSIEKQLHSKFKQKRKRGELFSLDFNDLKKIKEEMETYDDIIDYS